MQMPDEVGAQSPTVNPDYLALFDEVPHPGTPTGIPSSISVGTRARLLYNGSHTPIGRSPRHLCESAGEYTG